MSKRVVYQMEEEGWGLDNKVLIWLHAWGKMFRYSQPTFDCMSVCIHMPYNGCTCTVQITWN